MICIATNYKGKTCQNKAVDETGLCRHHHINRSLKPSDGNYFEKEVLKTLRVLGYTVERDVKLNGCQVDIYGEIRTGVISLRLMVECKDYGDEIKVGIKELKQFYSSFNQARNHGVVDKGLFVTTNGFTAPAKTFASSAGIDCTTYSELSTQLVNLDAYIDQIIRDYENSSLSKYYVDLSATETEDYEGNEAAIIYKPLDPFVDRCLFDHKLGKLALLGNFGTGKSTFCRKYAYTLAKRYKAEKTGRIPVIVNLKGYDSRFHIQQLILDVLQYKYGVNITSPVSLALQRIGKFIFLFDGLDEMDARANPDMVRANLQELDTISEIKENKFIVTCRTHFFRNRVHAEVLSDFVIAFIPEWGESELKEYLEKRFGGDWPNQINKIYGTHNLRELAKTPLFLDMIAETLAQLGNHVKRIELYQTYTEFWIKDQSKRRNALLKANDRRTFVKELAVKLFSENLYSCHYSAFNGIVRQCLTRVRSNGDLHFEVSDGVQLDFISSDIQTCTFLVRDTAGNYSFKHNSLVEFFVAQDLNDRIRAGCFSCLEGSIIPVEIRGFLIEYLNEDTPIDILKNGIESASGDILRENLLAIISQLNIDIPIPELSTAKEENISSKNIVGFLRGNKTDFEFLFKKFYKPIVNYLVREGSLEHEAEDIIVEVFYRTWVRKDVIEGVQHFQRYLYKSALNAFIDLKRKKRTTLIDGNSVPDHEYIAYNPENEVEKLIQLTILREGIELLPHMQRLIIKGCLKDQKVNQIAEVLNVTASTVYSLREHAIKKLRAYFRSKGYKIKSWL